MLAADSPWRRLPADLPRRQVLFIDGLRLSAQMAASSLRALEGLLRDLTKDDGSEVGDRTVDGLVHAYGVIDAVNRFREVLRVFPRMKKGAPFQAFMKATTPVKDIRDHIQHLNNELDAVGEQRSAALGVITWLGPSPTPNAPPGAWMLVPGTFYQDQITLGPVVDTHASLPAGSIAEPRLVTGAHAVRLDDLVQRVFAMLSSLEGSLSEFAVGKQTLGSDVLMHFSLTPVSQDPLADGDGLVKDAG